MQAIIILIRFVVIPTIVTISLCFLNGDSSDCHAPVFQYYLNDIDSVDISICKHNNSI